MSRYFFFRSFVFIRCKRCFCFCLFVCILLCFVSLDLKLYHSASSLAGLLPLDAFYCTVCLCSVFLLNAKIYTCQRSSRVRTCFSSPSSKAGLRSKCFCGVFGTLLYFRIFPRIQILDSAIER